ncbi:carbonic anhydrase 15 [Mesocricetus auratus]|uniref:Carbonic anhydrase 15 n=1 Tax=Mesocricetus auratus TaxID=10036 RepID=A0ABM2XWR1_MESAU|nr:carbonic anhydrase 15 [Mesocricetus auratus]
MNDQPSKYPGHTFLVQSTVLQSLSHCCIMWALGFLLQFLAMQPVAQVDSNGTWCYDSQDPMCGPSHWKELAPACGGPTQSPINIDLRLVQRDYTLEPFIFQGYDSAPLDPWTLENDGHTVLLRVNSCQLNCPVIRGAGLPSPGYRLLQLHFHWGSPGHKGSEHSLDEKRSSMEMHMLHVNTKYQSMREALSHQDGFAVLAVLLVEEDRDNTNFSAIVSGLKNVSLPGKKLRGPIWAGRYVGEEEGGFQLLSHRPGVSVNLTATFPLASLLPSSVGLLSYYRYSGSLTTPGCEPAVLWTVFENTVPIGRTQVGATNPLQCQAPSRSLRCHLCFLLCPVAP